MAVTHNITLDVDKNRMRLDQKVHVRTGDKSSQTVRCALTKDGAAYTPASGATAKLEVLKADNTWTVTSATVSGSNVSGVVPLEAMSAPGECKRAYFRIIDGSKEDTTEDFHMYVFPNAYDQAIESKPYSDQLDELIAAASEELQDVIDDVRDIMTGAISKEYVLEQQFDMTLSANVGSNSDILIYESVPLTIVVTEYSGAPFVNAYSSADTSNIAKLLGIGTYTLTPGASGNLRFYAESSATVKGYVFAKTRFDGAMPGKNAILYNKQRSAQFYGPVILATAARHVGKTLNFNGMARGNCNVTNYELFLIDAGPTCTEPIRIRNSDGSLIYDDIRYTHSDGFSPDGGTGMATFGIDGGFLREVRLPDLISRDPLFQDDEYYAMLFEYPAVYPNNKWVANRLNIGTEAYSYNTANENIAVGTYLYDSVRIIKGKNVNANAAIGAATLSNVSSYLVNSGSGNLTEPIRIRNYDGSLVYKGFSLENPTASSSTDPAIIWFFGVDGVLLRYLKRSQWLARNEKFLADEYYAMFMQWNGFAWKWRVLGQGIKRVYNVGPNGDWQSFTDMLVALKDDSSEKTVYIEPGEYDIFEEMGGSEYMESLTSASSLNWRDVCHVVPPNTRIVGIGDVWLNWMPTAEEIIDQAHAVLFAPLNVSGTCCIENIKLKMRNGRYTIHDETSGMVQFDGAEHIYKNVEAYMIQDGHQYGNHCAFGCGHNGNMHFVFDNCVFSSYIEDVWWCHDWDIPTQNSTLFEFDNTIFLVGDAPASPRFATDTAERGRMDTAKFNGCVMSGVRHNTTTGKTRQVCRIVSTLCKHLTEVASGGIVISEPMKQYLTIPD